MDRKMSGVQDGTYPCSECLRRYTSLEFLQLHKNLVHGESNLGRLKCDGPTELSSMDKNHKDGLQKKRVSKGVKPENGKSAVNNIKQSMDIVSCPNITAGKNTENEHMIVLDSYSIKKEPTEDFSHSNEMSGVSSVDVNLKVPVGYTVLKSLSKGAETENGELTMNDTEQSMDIVCCPDVTAGKNVKNENVIMFDLDRIKKEPTDDFSHSNEMSGVSSVDVNVKVPVGDTVLKSLSKGVKTENGDLTTNDTEQSMDIVSCPDVTAGKNVENENVIMLDSDRIKKEPAEDISHSNEMSGASSADESLKVQVDSTVVKKRNKSNTSGIYTCTICCLIFYERRKLKKHRQTHLPEKPYKCDVCDSAFYESSKLKVHKRIHTGEKPYKCEFCDSAFAQWSNLNTHRRSHTGERPYKCDVCEATFADGSKLRTHQKIHTGEKPYNCDICGVSFSQNGHLQRHKRIHTGEKPYKCDVCNAAFSDSGRLKTHQKIHSGENPYKCDICDESFNENSKLKTHKKVHAVGKVYKCDVCGVDFPERIQLKRHKFIHTGVHPFKCDVCGLEFSDGIRLKSHKRRHRRDKPFVCEVCNMPFAHPKTLNTHKKVHAEERPHKCSICGEGFSDQRKLKTHKENHFVGKPYRCGVCDERFAVKSELDTHKMMHVDEFVLKCEPTDVWSNMHAGIQEDEHIEGKPSM